MHGSDLHRYMESLRERPLSATAKAIIGITKMYLDNERRREVEKAEIIDTVRFLSKKVETYEQLLSISGLYSVETYPYSRYANDDIERCSSALLEYVDEAGILDPVEFSDKSDFPLELIFFCIKTLKEKGELEDAEQ